MSSADAETAAVARRNSATTGRWPLVGRDEESTFIARALGDLRHPGAGVVLAGSAGVGKTRLAREALDAVANRGTVVRWAVATHATRAVPLGALGPHLWHDDSDPALMLPRAARALSSSAAGDRVVIGVDDAHLLDPASALVLHEIVLARSATVLITVRTGEPAPDAITRLWKDARLDRLEVQALSESEIARLLESVLDGPVEQVSAERLWRITGGVTLFLRHLVDAERQSGRLRRELGVWRWCGGPGLSGRLAWLIEHQMGGLEPPVREVLDVLAIAEPLEIAALRQLTTQSAIEVAEAKNLIVVGGEVPQVRLAHPLYGELCRATTGRDRTRRLNGRIVRVLAATDGDSAEAVLKRALLACDSDLSPQPDLYTAGARTALALDDVELGERLASAAVRAAGGFEARLLRAGALTGSGRAADAVDELVALERLAATDGQHVQVARLHVINLFWGSGDVDKAEAVLRESDSTICDVDARRELTSLAAVLQFCQGRPHRAVAAAREALAAPDPSDTVVLQSCYALVGALGLTGHVDRADAVAARGVEAGTRAHSPVISTVALRLQHVNALANAGYLHRAGESAAIAAEESADSPARTRVKAKLVLGRVLLQRGDLTGAVRALREARAGMSDDCMFGLDSVCCLALAQALASLGRGEDAVRMLAEAETLRSPALAFLDPERATVQAWTLAALGQTAEARVRAHRGASVAARCGASALEVLALHTAVRLGDTRCGDRLSLLARLVDGPRVAAAAHHAVALAEGDGAALTAAAREFEDLGDRLSARDAADQAATITTTAPAEHSRKARGPGQVLG